MNYLQIARVANKMLVSFGTTGTLTRTSASTYNPSTSVASPTTNSETVKLIALPYPEKMVDGTHILVGDQQVLMSALDVDAPPKPGDTLNFSGADHVVVNVKNYSPTGTSVVYELQVRK